MLRCSGPFVVPRVGGKEAEAASSLVVVVVVVVVGDALALMVMQLC